MKGHPMSRFIPSLCALSCALALSACGGLPIHATVDTLTSETAHRASEHFEFNSIVSLSGLGPQQGVALLAYQPQFSDLRENSSSYSLALSPTYSFVSVRDFPMVNHAKDLILDEAHPQTVAEDASVIAMLRDQTQILQQLVVEQLAIDVQLVMAQVLQKQLEANGLSAGEIARVRDLLGVDAISNDGKKQPAWDSAVALKQQQKLELITKITQLREKIHIAAQARNVVITRWARERRTTFNAGLSELFAFSGHGHEATSGTLIYGDIRVSNLHAGEDLADMLRYGQRHFSWLAGQVAITTYLQQARHTAYVVDENLDRALAGRLKYSDQQWQDIRKLLVDQSLKLEATYSSAMQLNNSALLSDSYVRTYPSCFFPPEQHTGTIKAAIQRSEGYQALFTVQTHIKEPLRNLLASTPTQYQRVAMKACEFSPDSGSLDFDRTQPACAQALANWSRLCAPAPLSTR